MGEDLKSNRPSFRSWYTVVTLTLIVPASCKEAMAYEAMTVPCGRSVVQVFLLGQFSVSDPFKFKMQSMPDIGVSFPLLSLGWNVSNKLTRP